MPDISTIFGWLRPAAIGILMLLPAAQQSAQAAAPAESFVAENIDKGLRILNGTPSAQRTTQFQSFLEGLTDIGRIAKFTLGNARRTASPGDIAAFDAAFKNYAEAVYQSRLSQYSGQTLKVTGSTEPNPGDTIVKTVMIDPAQSGQQPLEVDFRVVSESGRLVVIDVAIAGVWLSIEERDQFSAFLSQHNGSIPALVTHLNQSTAQMKSGGR
ncbi:MAG TPA: ABC transporter substrate-binding protein [Rhizomicrobium sp.]|jgi:phospholipid transport system substrate-binding protein|nr:ABC transporter substrate-binding protein [Rhizomicrobium sp.]